MFIVQDRETGLYYRNSRSNGKRWGRSEWVADLSEVLPLRTMNAVAQLFKGVGNVQYEFSRRRWQKDSTLSECCKLMKIRTGKPPANQCQHYKDAVVARLLEARRKYRVIEVTLQLGADREL